MKNFKKVLSLVLAFAMVLSTMTVAFAETMNDTEAKALYELGLFKGYEADEYVPGLEDATDAAQALVLIGRALGWETAADAEVTFTDVPAYAVPYVAYAVEAGITDGVSETEFGVDVISGKRMVTWFLAAAGYDKAAVWADTETYAEAADLEIPEGTLRDDVVGVIYDGLMVTLEGETTTVLDALVADDADLEAKAIELGLLEEEPEELAVESVTAINLIQAKVVFNQEVDSETAETATNYSVTDFTTHGTVTVDDAELLEDGKTVVLTFDGAADQQDTVDVTVEDVETPDEVVIADTTVEDVAFLDMTIPTADAATVVGNDTIKVTFSEPMTTASLVKANFEVDGGDLYIDTVTPMNNNTEANIVLYSDLDEGDVDVKVTASVEDEAGFGVITTTLTATVVEDETAPTVIGFKDASETGVTLIFDEEIEVAVLTAANFYHTNSNNPIDGDIVEADDLSDDGKELTLEFTTNNLPEGTAYVYILKETVNDLWDNDNAQIMYQVEVTLDETAPTMDTLEVVTESQITLEFSEAVDADTAEDVDNYTLLDADGEEADLIDDINYASKVATIDFSENLSGEYTIVIENIEDASENEIVKVSETFDVDDLTAPVVGDFTATLYKAGAADQFVIVDFGEEMTTEGTYSVLDDENYEIDGNKLSEIDAESTFSVISAGKVKIEIESSVDDTTNGVDLTAGANKVVVARVADAAGNYTVAFTNTFDLDASATVGIDSVELTDVDTIEVTFDDDLEDFDSTDFNLYSTTKTADNALDISKRSISTDSDGNTVVTLTLVDELTYDAKIGTDGVNGDGADAGDAVNLITVANPNSENEYGEALVGATTVAVADVTAAILYTDGDSNTSNDFFTDNGNGTFDIQFSEDISISNASLLGNDLVVKADNDTLVLGVDYSVAAQGTDSLRFTLLGDYLGFDGDVAVARAASTNYLTDVAGNDVDEFDTDDVELDSAAVASIPSATNATTNDADSLVITVSEALYAVGTDTAIVDGADLVANVTDTTDTGDTFAVGEAIYDADDLTITIVFTGVVSDNDVITFNFDQYEDAGDNVSVDTTYTYDLAGTIWE